MNAPVKQILCLLSILCLSLFISACGPEEDEFDAILLTDQTKRIAQEYQTHQSLDVARTQLSELEVANGTQWLLFVTESSLTARDNPVAMNALVELSLDLGLSSEPIRQYAAANGLLPEAVSVVNPPAAPEPDQAAVAQPVPASNQPAPEQPANTELANAESAQAVATLAMPTDAPTAVPPTPELKPLAKAVDAINVRGGPGTNYTIVGALQAGEEMSVTAKNQTGDWWEVLLNSGQTGWVFGQLVNASGVDAIAVAANIPAPPPPTATPIPAPPTAPPEPEAPPVDTSNPYFTLTNRRLWGKQENDGCVGKHLLRIYVKDAAGNPLNGVVLKGVYIGEEIATGEQGKGDGIMEYDLHGSGEAFTVIRDVDGREAGSDQAGGFTTRSLDIDKPTLIATGYCSDNADCDVFYSSYGCHGHHSWEAEFVRNY